MRNNGRARVGAPGTAGPAADLHTHSTASDGSVAPAALVEQARAAGLSVVGLTDHDTLDGVAQAQQAGRELGVAVIVGVELSAMEGDHEVHLLGLHLDHVTSLEPALADLRGARRRRADTMVDTLRALGVLISIEAVMAEAGDGAVGRPHVARALIAGGWARDQRDAFDRYLGAGRPAFVNKQRLTVPDAIRLLHAAGGVAVLAHPGREGTLARLTALRTLGLDGVEVRHPSHSAEDEARLAALADHLDLVPSGGSDWHGAAEGPRVLGAVTIPVAWVERQLERAKTYRETEIARWNSTAASRS